MDYKDFLSIMVSNNGIMYGCKDLQRAKRLNFCVKAGQRKPQPLLGLTSPVIKAICNQVPTGSLESTTDHSVTIKVNWEIGRYSSTSQRSCTVFESNLDWVLNPQADLRLYTQLVQSTRFIKIGDLQILMEST